MYRALFICLYSCCGEEFMKIDESMLLCPYSHAGLFHALANREMTASFVL